MVRAPCCEKMGLKRGPWTTQEDHTLISYIQQYGHGNWRALPKQAGLLRCGKSCRLRWTNYLRPDIKRGNFSQEEEETIIKLHEMLGNRWSTIAARLPGRTDNEIKNVWHTHLKKRLKHQQNKEIVPETKHQYSSRRIVEPKCDELSNSNTNSTTESEEPGKDLNQSKTSEKNQSYVPVSSPQQSSSELSSSGIEFTDSSETIPSFDDSFWADVLPEEHLSVEAGFSGSNIVGTDYWYNLFMKAGEELLEVSDF